MQPSEQTATFIPNSTYRFIYIYVRLEVRLDAHGFVYILYFTIFALHVSGAICIHHQEHKLQRTTIGVRNVNGM
jgi:hypothetical protein